MDAQYRWNESGRETLAQFHLGSSPGRFVWRFERCSAVQQGQHSVLTSGEGEGAQTDLTILHEHSTLLGKFGRFRGGMVDKVGEGFIDLSVGGIVTFSQLEIEMSENDVGANRETHCRDDREELELASDVRRLRLGVGGRGDAETEEIVSLARIRPRRLAAHLLAPG